MRLEPTHVVIPKVSSVEQPYFETNCVIMRKYFDKTKKKTFFPPVNTTQYTHTFYIHISMVSKCMYINHDWYSGFY